MPRQAKARQPRRDSGFRTERDSMGELQVPAQALWGAQTQRAVQNFPISGRPMPREFIRALGLIKAAAAEVNGGLGLLGKGASQSIRAAALSVASGEHDAQFAHGIVFESEGLAHRELQRHRGFLKDTPGTV